VKIRDVVKMLEDDGWVVVRQRGSHRQYKHATKPGLVTVAGNPSDDVAPGIEQHSQTGRTEVMKYLIVIEQAGTGFSAYSPDLPGCVATGSTRDEVEREMKDAIAFHLDGLKAEGMAIPQPSSSSSYVEIPA
jgi:predicted RNase H-like HicB family nuclease/predicted RNA binding protein YcfA (HicA-like mRNA interferase family)